MREQTLHPEKINKKIFQNQTICFQVVTQVFDKIANNFQYTKSSTHTKNNSFSVPVCSQYSNTNIPSGVFLDVQLFLNIPGRTIIPGYSWVYNFSWKILGVPFFLDQKKKENFGADLLFH